MDKVNSYGHDFDSCRIRFVRKSGFCALDVEIIRTSEDERVYVNIHGLPLPPCPTIAIQTTIEGQIDNFQAYVMEGGQRLLLDEESSQIILDALWEENSVSLKVGSYSKEFLSDNFPELYQ